MRNRFLLGAALAGAMLPATAQAATLINGSISGWNVHTSGNGLLIDLQLIGDGTFSFELGATDVVVPLFKLRANESDVSSGSSSEDQVARPISVDFAFTSPDVNPLDDHQANGQTDGHRRTGLVCLFITQCIHSGSVTWNDTPLIFNFGNGGQFSLDLSDEVFSEGVYGLGKKYATVDGTFHLIKAPVPEPSTWALMVLGVGAAGAAMRTRRREQVRVTYA